MANHQRPRSRSLNQTDATEVDKGSFPTVQTAKKPSIRQDTMRKDKRGTGDSPSLEETLKVQRQSQKDVGQLFDELILDLGGYGKYQQRLVFLVVLPCFFMLAFVQCVVAFVMVNPTNFWCNIPELSDQSLMQNGLALNMTEADRQRFIPWDTVTGNPSTCYMYKVNYTQLLKTYNLKVKSVGDYLNSSGHNYSLGLCEKGWDFDMQHGDTSVVTEFNLVCDSSPLLNLSVILMAISTIFGILVGGYVGDRFGRKKPFFTFFFIMIVFGISFAFSPSFSGFLVLAIIHSFGSGPVYSILYTMAVEMLTSSSRLSMVVWLSITYAVGAMIFTLIAYFVQQWRFLTIYGTSPFALVFIYWFFLPESPRFLLVRERFEEVEVYVRRIASVNSHSFNESCQEQLKQIFTQCSREVDLQDVESVDCFDGKRMGKKRRVWCGRRGSWLWLFATPTMLRKTLLLTYLMCALQICYYGLRLYTPQIVGSDKYFTNFLSNVVEIPGIFFAWLLCDRLGRRSSVMISFLLSFLCCIFSTSFPPGEDFFWGSISVMLIARMFISSAYVTGELLVHETFPTVIRMQGVAWTGAVSYLLSHLGPFIIQLKKHSDSLPLVVFGCLALVAVLCVFLLPETKSAALPETVEEADMRGAGLFRRAVNFRAPAMRWKKKKSHVSVSFHKNNGTTTANDATTNRTKPEESLTVVTLPAGEMAPPPATLTQLNQPDGHSTKSTTTATTATTATDATTATGRSSPAVHSVHPVHRSEIERVAASLKRVPKQNRSVHFTVGSDPNNGSDPDPNNRTGRGPTDSRNSSA